MRFVDLLRLLVGLLALLASGAPARTESTFEARQQDSGPMAGRKRRCRPAVGLLSCCRARLDPRAGRARRAIGSRARAVLLILGARQCVQALVTARTGWRALSAGVDVLHAASMLPVLAVAPRRGGRFAVTQILTAAALATLEVAADRR